LISGKKRESETQRRPTEAERSKRGVLPPSVSLPAVEGEQSRRSDPTEPGMLEIELTVPTSTPYSSLRLRTTATRKPNETMSQLADRLTHVLLDLARQEALKVGVALRDVAPPR
jgi:hypothetical protein